MKTELLPPDTLTQQLKTRRHELLNLLNLKMKSQKNLPQGHLRIEQKKGARAPQFYHFTNPADTHGVYIPAAKQELARQKLITPVTFTDQQYIENWQNITWHPRPFAADAPEFFTARNEQVRSKSEVIIADTLSRHNIPYRYEYPLELKNGDIYHPDFLCLNVRTRQEFIWEHFGMMNSPAYASRTVSKLKVFSENNILPGKNLIITMETADLQLSSRQVENLIKEYLE